MSALIVFGKMTNGQPYLDSDFISETVASGNTSSPCPSTYNYVEVTAINANTYFALSTGTPDATTNPREYLQTGSKMILSCPVGTRVNIL